MYEELIDDLRETAEYIGPNNYELPIMLYDNLLKAADAMESLSAYKKIALDEHNRAAKTAWEHRWISVEERLPEDHMRVLIINDDEKMMIGERAEDGWWYKYFAYDVDRWDEKEQGRITHWMQLPEPPKEET